MNSVIAQLTRVTIKFNLVIREFYSSKEHRGDDDDGIFVCVGIKGKEIFNKIIFDMKILMNPSNPGVNLDNIPRVWLCWENVYGFIGNSLELIRRKFNGNGK